MGQVLRGMNLNPPSGWPTYNLGDYIRQRGLCEKERKHLRKERERERESSF